MSNRDSSLINTSRLSLQEAWRVAGISISTLLLLTFYLYQQTIVYLVGIWNQMGTGNYAHGYLVLLISVYLIIDNRQRLKVLSPCPVSGAIFAVMVACLLWMVAVLVDIAMLQTVGLLLLILTLVWMVLGGPVTKILLFPIVYIGFAIPVWFPLSPVLQGLTADAVFWMIRVLEVPALRIENMIVIASGKLSIEEACGGLNYFLAAMTLGTLYGYLNYTTLAARVFIVLISAGSALLLNILRVFIVVYLGYKTDMQHPYVNDHLTLGWYLFGGLVTILLVIDSLWHRMRHSEFNTKSVLADEVQAPCNKGKSQFLVFTLIAALLISTGPVAIKLLTRQSASDSFSLRLDAFSTIGQWSSVAADDDDWVPQYRGADNYKMAFLGDDNQQVQLFMGVYSRQQQGEELINDLNTICDGKTWHCTYQRGKVLNTAGRQVFEQLLVNNVGEQRLVWYWYHVAEQDTINKYYAKALQLVGMLKGAQQASVIAIATPLGLDPELARKRLAQFSKELTPRVGRWLDGH